MPDQKSQLHKKIFSKIDSQSSKIQNISPLKRDEGQKSPKKIIPTLATGGLREKFKNTFIPLFIEVFELRQMIQNHKADEASPSQLLAGKTSKSPEEILRQLEQLQNNIEESRRWHEGMILQIERGIQEAKEALLKPKDQQPSEKTRILTRLLKKIRSMIS